MQTTNRKEFYTAEEYAAAKDTNSQYMLRIVHEEDAQSPREDDNLGKMACWHKRYNLGDDEDEYEPKILNLARLT